MIFVPNATPLSTDGDSILDRDQSRDDVPGCQRIALPTYSGWLRD